MTDEARKLPKMEGVVVLAPREGKYIDPIKLLHYLEQYAIIYAEQTAKPGLDATKTELARGQRLAYLELRKRLQEVIKHEPD